MPSSFFNLSVNSSSDDSLLCYISILDYYYPIFLFFGDYYASFYY